MNLRLLPLLLFPAFLHAQLPDTAVLYNYLLRADSLRLNGQYPEAEAELDQVMAWWPDQRPDSLPLPYLRIFLETQYGYATLDNVFSRFRQMEVRLTEMVSLAESHSDLNDVRAGAIHGLALLYYNLGELEACQTYLKQAIDLNLEVYGPESLNTATAYNTQANLSSDLGNYAEAREYYLKCLAIREQLLPADHPYLADTYHNLGILAYEEGDYDRAISWMEKGFAIEQQSLPPDHPNLSYSYNNLGVLYDERGFHERALEAYRKAMNIQIAQLGADHPQVAQSWHNIGVVYQEKGDLRRALDHYQQSLAIQQKVYPQPNDEILANLENMAATYFQMEEYEKARTYLLETMEAYATLYGEVYPEKANLLYQLAKIDQAEDRLESALAQLEQSLQLDRNIRPDHPDLALAQMVMGEIYLEQGQYDASLEAYKRALERTETAFGPRHPRLAQIYNGLGTLFAARNSADAAARSFHRAMQSNFSGGWEGRLNELPGEDLTPMSLPDHLVSLQGKALALPKMSGSTDSLWDVARAHWEAASRTVNELQSSYRRQESKLRLRSQAGNLYAGYLAALYDRYRQSKDDRLAVRAFELADQAQAALLREWLVESDARLFSGLPDSLLEKERQLRIDQGHYDKQVFEAELAGSLDSTRLADLREKKFAAREAYDALVSKLEADFPQYYQLKYEHSTVEAASLQKQLPEGLVVVRYFVGPESTHILSIERNQVRWAVVETSAWLPRLRSLLWLLQRPGRGEDLQAFAEAGSALYQILLEPVLNTQTTRLLILPDGALAYLPFELLLTEQPTQAPDYGTLPYLLRTMPVSYSYSAALLARKYRSKRPQRWAEPFLGIAPAYTSSREGSPPAFPGGADRASLLPLAYNGEEVLGIQELLGGVVHQDTAANEAAFKRMAPNARVLHLAMHALLSDTDPMYSGLAFEASSPPEAAEDDFLYAYELFGLELGAELVTLSACNSGDGQLQRGEGVMSLSRAFRYAGCPNQVMSLWQVEDRAAFDLMQSFYHYLQEGRTEAEALRQAKLDYLSSQDRAHPFYWGNFVFIGENALETGPAFPRWTLWMLGAFALLGIGWGVFRRQS